MKKLFMAALLAVTVITSAFAGETKVNATILANFKAQFKNVTEVTWSIGDHFAKASFIENQVRTEAFFSPAGEMIGISQAITLDQLSVQAKRSFAKKFGSYIVKEAIRFEGVEETAYFISAENETEKIIIKVDDIDQVLVIDQKKK